MKPFNLEEAKAGKPVCTRNGHPARIICFDKKHSDFPIVALITYGNEELDSTYTNKGCFYSSGEESENDLFMAGEHKEGWINIYNIEHSKPHVSYDIYPTKEEAQHAIAALYLVDTIKIEWDE